MSAVNEHISDVNEHISTVETHMTTVATHMQTVSSHLSASHVSSVNSESGAVTIEAGDDTVTLSKDQGKITIKSNVTGTDFSGEIENLAEKTGPLAYNKTTGVLAVSGNSFSELSIDGNLKVSGVVNIGTEGGSGDGKGGSGGGGGGSGVVSPLEDEVEYATGETYWGEPVYIKSWQGEMSSDPDTLISDFFPSEYVRIVSYGGEFYDGSAHYGIPLSDAYEGRFASIWADPPHLVIRQGGMGGCDFHLWIKYTAEQN
jgi:hypothetical protein